MADTAGAVLGSPPDHEAAAAIRQAMMAKIKGLVETEWNADEISWGGARMTGQSSLICR
jgi:hypothetical protein